MGRMDLFILDDVTWHFAERLYLLVVLLPTYTLVSLLATLRCTGTDQQVLRTGGNTPTHRGQTDPFRHWSTRLYHLARVSIQERLRVLALHANTSSQPLHQCCSGMKEDLLANMKMQLHACMYISLTSFRLRRGLPWRTTVFPRKFANCACH
ncbi:hypothetical protein EV363DRAFT_962446 [Boletus edulis]|nr:hypothetical protein EV363DRAFT_962446 [Boletus edulis]